MLLSFSFLIGLTDYNIIHKPILSVFNPISLFLEWLVYGPRIRFVKPHTIRLLYKLTHLYRVGVSGTARHCTEPHRIPPHRIPPHRIPPHRITRWLTPHRIALHRTTPHCVALYSTAPYRNSLNWTASLPYRTVLYRNVPYTVPKSGVINDLLVQ